MTWWPACSTLSYAFAVICVRTSGLSFSTECPPPDPRWLQYLWDLGEIAKQGGDIRDCIFGPLDPGAVA
jgi:hypothetical protein